MPVFDSKLAEERQAGLASGAKNIWAALTESPKIKPDTIGKGLIGLMQAGTFPFSALGKTDWQYNGPSDLIDAPISEAVSPWMMMRQEAKQNVREMPSAVSKLMDRWQSASSAGSRESWELRTKLAQALDESTSEALKKVKLANITKQTKTRRGENGLIESLLFRGMGNDEANAIKSNGGATSDVASFTTSPNIAYQFAAPHVSAAWVPQDKIAGYLPQLGADPGIKTPGANHLARREKEILVRPGVNIDHIVPADHPDLYDIIPEFNHDKRSELTKKLEENSKLQRSKDLADWNASPENFWSGRELALKMLNDKKFGGESYLPEAMGVISPFLERVFGAKGPADYTNAVYGGANLDSMLQKIMGIKKK